jgi:hypothetical protein
MIIRNFILAMIILTLVEIYIYVQKYQFVPHRKHITSHYRDQPVNVVWGNSRCLLRESYGTHKCTVWAECGDFIYKNSVRTSQETHYVSTKETNRLVLFRETVAVYCENHMEHTNTLCGQNAETLYIRIQFVPRRKHITSPLQSQTG